MHEIIGKLFNICYRAFYKDSKLFCDINSAINKKTIANFIILLQKKEYDLSSIGEDWLRHYFRYQFSYWLDKDIKRKITIQWILGKKAFDRYDSIDNWQQVNYHIDKNTAFIVFEDIEQVDDKYEDIERKRYFNKDIGLLWCIDFTTLYKNGPICLRCKFRKECKELLISNYPKIAKTRKLI